jgi:hypothetical protein
MSLQTTNAIRCCGFLQSCGYNPTPAPGYVFGSITPWYRRLEEKPSRRSIASLNNSLYLSKMPANKILSSQAIKTVANSGKNITVKYATKTETWDRSYLASNVQDDFSKAIEKADIPAGATVAILA